MANASAPECSAAFSPPTVVHLAWRKYKAELQQNPLRTKAITSACIAALSDVIAQRITSSKYDITRTLKMALFGFVWSGPSAHYWQDFLQRVFAGKAGAEVLLQKVALDQLTYGPLCNILFMSYTSMVVGGMPLSSLGAKLGREYPSVQLNGWRVWPLASLVNYRFVPLQFRVLVVNLVALFWSTFLILRSRAVPTPRWMPAAARLR